MEVANLSAQKIITGIPEWQSHDLEQFAILYLRFPRKEHLHSHLFGPVSEGSYADKNKQKVKKFGVFFMVNLDYTCD